MKNFKIKDGPFVRTTNDTRRIMKRLIIALVPIILFSFYKNGVVPFTHGVVGVGGLIYPIAFVLLPALVCYIVEMVYSFLILKNRNDDLWDYMRNSYAFIPGLFLGLILPYHTPFGLLVFGAIVSTIVGKMLYGGFGHNVFNPALIGRFFIITMYALVISNHGGYLNPHEMDTMSGATPLTHSLMVDGIGSYDTLVAPYGSLWDFFFGTIPGAMGETSSLLCLLAFAYLSITKVIKWKIPVFYVGTVWIMSFFIGVIGGSDFTYSLFQILSGGLFFGAVFMATDPVTSPVTSFGQVIYGVCLGVLTIICRYLTSYPEGVLTSILIMNLFVGIVDSIGNKAKFHFKYVIISVLFLLISVGGFTGYIGFALGSSSEKGDINYSIVDKKIDGSRVSYIVTEKGYGGDIKASIVIENGVVVKFEVLEQQDSFYGKVESTSYIQRLLAGQKDLNDVDTVSGATVTSSALKKMLEATIDDYQKSHIQIEDDSKPEIPSVPDIPEEKADFQILSVEEVNQKIVYTVVQRGFQSDLKLQVEFEEDRIISILVLEESDSYFRKIEGSDYVQKLIDGQDLIEDVDTVSGATVTSSALKKAIHLVLEDYQKGDYRES